MHPVRLLSPTLAFLLAVTAWPAAQTPATGDEIALWPGSAPGSEHVPFTEKITERSTDPAKPDRITTGIVRPLLRVHRPAQPNGAAVIIAPGGGYSRIVIDKEGPDTAAWLNRLGVTAFVLKYRLPEEGHAQAEDVPLEDAQRAVRLVRARAAQWGLDPARIGFLGYSAGGHLATTLTFFHERPVYAPVDTADALSARPDFVILGYPAAGTAGEPPASLDGLAPRARLLWKYRVEAATDGPRSPAFLFHASDDPAVSPGDSLRVYRALQAARASAELHIFKSGGHGFGIRDAKGPAARWPDLCEAWLRQLGVLP